MPQPPARRRKYATQVHAHSSQGHEAGEPSSYPVANPAEPLFWTLYDDGRFEHDVPAWQAHGGGNADFAGWLAAVVHPDDQQPTRQRWEQAKADSQAFQIEHRLRGVATDYRPFLATARPVRDATGQVQSWQGVSVDLSLTKRAAAYDRHEATVEREVLLRNEQNARAQLAAVLDVLPAGVAIYAATGQLLHINTAGERLTHQPILPGEAATDRHRRYAIRHIDGTIMPELETPSGRVRRGETFTDIECLISGVTGPDTYLLTSGAPLVDVAGNVTGGVVIFQDATALRQLEQTARTQRDLAEGIIETTPFGVAVFDATDDFRCIRHNMPFLQLMGAVYQERGSILNVPLIDLFDAESGGRVYAIFAQSRASGQPFALDEFPAVLFPDPEPRWYRWSLTPLHDAHGMPEAMLVSAVEITELVRAREERRIEAKRLEAVLEVLPTGVVLADATGKLLQFNESFRETWGEGAPLVTTIADYAQYQAWWADGRRVQPQEWGLAIALQTGESVFNQEFDIVTFDGLQKTILNSAAPIRDATNAIIGGVVAARDITDQRALSKQTHNALDALLAIAEALVTEALSSEEATDQLSRRLAELTCRMVGCQRVSITTIDPATERLVLIAIAGLAPEIEKAWWEQERARTIHVNDMPDRAFMEAMRAGETVSYDMTQPPYNDQPNPLGVTVVVIAPMRVGEHLIGWIAFDHGGKLHHYSADQVRLAGAVAQLIALVIERRRLMAEREAARAEALALADANQRMDDFLGLASHELRTPLTSIKTLLQLTERAIGQFLTTEAEDDARLVRAHKLLLRSDRQIGRLNRLIEDLLDVARIQGGSLHLDMQHCDLVAITREAVEEQQAVWLDRNITLQAKQSAVPLVADAERVGQVVVNYLTNALKYSASNCPVVVHVSMADGMARVDVVDRGPGLPKEHQAQIWERFHRVPDVEVMSGSGVGIGLGLFICRTIIERQGGQVGVTSVVGTGSTFWFTLPLLQPTS